MQAASIHDVKKELQNQNPEKVLELCLRLAKYKKENKELLTYLLFESENEQDFIRNLKAEMDTLFEEVNYSNLYYTKKGFRKILRYINKNIRYSGIKETELEILIYFCSKIKERKIRLDQSVALANLYEGQLKKINKTLSALHEDLQYDYQQQLAAIEKE